MVETKSVKSVKIDLIKLPHEVMIGSRESFYEKLRRRVL